LDVAKKATGKGTAPRAKITGAQSMFLQGEDLLKCAYDAIKAIIGLKTLNPNIMLIGDL
jgi:hypothetical protein